MNSIKDETLALIAGLINSDGHLQLKDTKGTVSFYSKNKKDIARVVKLFTENFPDIKPLIYKDFRLGNFRYKLFFASKDLCILLKNKGIAVGNKTNNPYEIPSWIVNGNLVLRKNYVKGFFDGEGSIYKEKTGRCRITLTQNKSEKLKENGIKHLEQIKKILAELGISSSPIRISKGNTRKDGSKSICMKLVINKSEFSKFHDKVGFFNEEKRKKIIEYVKI